MGQAAAIPQTPVAPLTAHKRGRLLAAVLVAHGLLLWLVSTALQPPLPRTGGRAFLPVSVPVQIVARMPAATTVGAKDKPLPIARQPAALLSPRMPPTFTAPAAAPTPAPATEVSPPAGPLSSPSADNDRQTMPAPAPPPLDLNLPPWRRGGPEPYSPARQAVEAQLGRRLASTPEARLARRLETEWSVEKLGDGRVRMRRGDACVMLSATQASELDPWNNRGTTPRNAGPCGSD